MTAYRSDTHFMNDAYDLFDSVISKPFDFATFRSVISSYIPVDVQQPPHFDDSSHREDTEKRDVINSNICDVDRGISNMGGNADLFIKHFNNFKHNNADLSLRLREMIDTDQYSDAAVLCHSIKGLAGMLGFTSLYSHVISLEDLLRQHIAERLFILSYDILALLFCINNDIQSICQLQI